MEAEIDGELGSRTEVSAGPTYGVRVTAKGDDWASVWHTPAQARELAAALIAAADELEGPFCADEICEHPRSEHVQDGCLAGPDANCRCEGYQPVSGEAP